MEFKKSTMEKKVVLAESFPEEIIDTRLIITIEPGDRMEDVRGELHRRLDQRFNRLFYSEYTSMKDRIAEGNEWQQLGLFADHLDISGSDLLRHDDDEE